MCNKAEEVPVKVLEEAAVIAAAVHSTTEMTTLIEADTTIVDVLEVIESDDDEDKNDGDIISSNKNRDYYYNDNENDDEDYNNYEEGSGSTYKTTTQTPLTTIKTTTTTRQNVSKEKVFKTPIKSPYKELIADIESHYTLKGKYMLLDSTIDKRTNTKKKSKKAYENKMKKKPKFTLENDQEVNYVDSNNHHISSDFIFNTNDAEDEEETSSEVELVPPKQHHAMRYRAEDDTIIDEILIDEMDKIMKDSSNEENEDPWKTYQPTPIPTQDTTKRPSDMKRVHTGACFNGHDSYFHYSDAETMRRIISYQIDLNLRFKTHSNNGLILWSGRHSAQQDDDFLSLGIEEG